MTLKCFNEIDVNEAGNCNLFLSHKYNNVAFISLYYTLGLVIGQALVIGQLDVFLSYFPLKE
jgi:hypothetical protein